MPKIVYNMEDFFYIYSNTYDQKNRFCLVIFKPHSSSAAGLMLKIVYMHIPLQYHMKTSYS